ncbi:ubiquitin thioesterase protein OTUB1 [Nematocida parisii]|uniref:uncharacterized protein n=1 Tax=Nematocida parisii (strain ERTm1 / ATCC PRA-289) TaxID=881290 RepID=UPI000264B5D7|nr:uncharacterized protein NEPG_00789 [Nematocida parisii ERTm1]KAI5126846.1 ubiquitin thioesterase protein OTUB1 [Nematocida parisii]EIJ94122.1 hypothetical protein NEPG_00789 [Nematocida parisii ERTm1]KAI5126926.1 ubiquitin thioesterase protein OTUB1 [Nematocida parisii]KAI5141036.1 ubiquitin thioesterase protein OTUB1 [Nematocida parisii]KAI5143376.1 ubiquitin thioesterase protein OTUB1 [Nematocida parisii]|eukprot:XP_013058618.1 hypothetical protein NEPG_00789 [Nematocida parisii ERTm1]
MDTNTADDSYVGKPLELNGIIENYKETPLYMGISALPVADSKVRLIKRDGNCFYYSIIFLMLEHYSTPAQAAELIQNFNRINNALVLDGVEDYLVNEFSDPIMSVLKAVGNNETTGLEALDNIFWNYSVAYFRLITSMRIKKHTDEFTDFIVDSSIEEYCSKNIEAINQYAGELEMIAITKALSISFDIIWIEKERNDHFTRGDGEKIGTLLFMADHFDILYL